jgi:hypothetical protein
VDTLLNFSPTSITATHCILRIVQTINILRDCSETFLFEMVGFMFTHYKVKFCIATFSKNYSWGSPDGSCADSSLIMFMTGPFLNTSSHR